MTTCRRIDADAANEDGDDEQREDAAARALTRYLMARSGTVTACSE